MTDDAIRDEAIALTQGLIRIDTSNPPGNETPAAEYLRDFLEENGVECELVARDPKRANLVARIRGTGDGPSLALLGHTDVVPADPREWQRPPFSGEVDDDGYLWGRGAVDMKNETATRALTIALLAREGFRPRGDLLLIAQADEEDGVEAVGMRWLVEARPDLRTDFAIDEGGGERIVLADGRVVVGCEVAQKATLPYYVHALGEAGHASRPEMGANAVPRLATLISRIAAYRPERRLVPGTAAMLAALLGTVPDDLDAAVAQAAALHPSFGEYLPALLSTTMAPTRLTGSDARNVMPARATVDVDCRVLPGTTQADLEAELRAALGDDLPYELEPADELTGGASSAVGTPLWDACQEALTGLDPGAALMPVVSTGFADSNYLREAWGTVAYGIWPFRTMSLEDYEATFHNRDERIHVDDLLYATRFHLDVVRRLLG